jgi:hypothetical protein
VKRLDWLEIDHDERRILIDAALDLAPVTGLTHNHYKYPARFSPKFAAAAINAFTKPGDLVCDPFMGGGTTIIEALANGRRAAGIDISSLAEFVAQTKTLNLKDTELEAVRRWAERLSTVIDIHLPSVSFSEWEEAGYYRNLNLRSNWRLTKAIEQALGSSERLRARNARQLARCVVLRTAQWALDGRKTLPAVEQFRSMMANYAAKMIAGSREFRERKNQHRTGKPRFINRSIIGIDPLKITSTGKPPKLILTSPPYPGVHVLYHRWQVDGRKETPAPFWIANKLDGAGLSHYTMGDRKNSGLRTYFENMKAAFDTIARFVASDTTVVQMLAFSAPDWQLARYLEMMELAGFFELLLEGLDTPDGRLWRAVPSRRWYADQRGKTSGSQEVVLFHRKAPRSGVAVKRPLRTSPISATSAEASGTEER